MKFSHEVNRTLFQSCEHSQTDHTDDLFHKLFPFQEGVGGLGFLVSLKGLLPKKPLLPN